jgi:hypothetical protein
MEQQLHSKFKVFKTSLDSDGNIPNDFNLTINGFIALNKVAVKSIGMQYDKELNKIIISIGYVEGQPYYHVYLQPINLGPLAMKEGQNFCDELGKALEGAVSAQDNSTICHEVYLDKNNDYIAIFLMAVN